MTAIVDGGTTPPRPNPLRPDPGRIPPGLKASASWVLWKYTLKDGRWTKPPFRVRGSGYASTTDPQTWAPFGEALHALENCGWADGIGVVLPDGIVGIDLDHVIDAAGGLEDWAGEIVERFAFAGAYCERSPGSDGVRIFVRGTIPRSGKGGPGNRAEIYAAGSPRYLTTTGARLPQSGDDVVDAQDALDWLHAKYFASKDRQRQRQQPQGGAGTAGEPDDAVLRRVRESRNSAKFRALFDEGDLQGYPGQSEADMALAGLLARYTSDAEQIDRLFRRSALMRDKWDSARGVNTYGGLTIEQVLSTQRSGYAWGGAWDGNGHGGADNDRGAAFLDALDVDAYRQHLDFDAKPPPIDALIHPLLVKGWLTIVAGDGGTLKSMMLLGAAFEIATGVPFISAAHNAFKRVAGGACLFLTAEESHDDIVRRRAKWIERAAALGAIHGIGSKYAHMMRDGARDVVVLPLANQVLTLYRHDGPTAAMQALERLCARVPGLVHVAIDPAGSFFRGDTSDAAQFGGFALELRSLASRLNISVALSHHTTKQAATLAAATGEAMGQHAASGTMMLINSARVGAVVQRMPKKAARDWGIEAKDAHRYISLSTPKANGVENVDQQWFLNDAGVPVPVDLQHADTQDNNDDRERAKAEKTDATLAQQLNLWGTTEYDGNKPMSKTALALLLCARAKVRKETALAFVESEISRCALVIDQTVRIRGSAQGAIRPGAAWGTSAASGKGF